MNFSTVDEILDFAVGGEEESAGFYRQISKKAGNPGMRALFEEFAREEDGHRAKLLAIKKGKLVASAAVAEKITDLKLADYMVDVVPSPDMEYQDCLILAMKKERAAFRLYSDLADIVSKPELKGTFLMLAREEARHKLRFEIEYDENILREN